MISNATFKHIQRKVQCMSPAQVKLLQNNLNTQLLTFPRLSDIPELLEIILEHLDFYELFKVMRVSRAFRNTIIGSPKLQHKLFLLQHQVVDPDFPLLDPDTKGPIVNPFVSHICANVLGLSFDLAYHSYREKRELLRWSRQPYPELHLQFELPICSIEDLVSRYHPLPGWRWRDFEAAKHDKKGSWADTYITSSPLYISIRFAEDLGWAGEWLETDYKLEAGEATVGALYDLSVTALQKLGDLEWMYSDRAYYPDSISGTYPPEGKYIGDRQVSCKVEPRYAGRMWWSIEEGV